MLKTIILEGELGKAVGETWRLDVASPNEAMRAIDTLTQGRLTCVLNTQINTGVGYVVTLSDRGLTSEKEYFQPCVEECITFSPELEGAESDQAKKNKKGIGQIIVGVVLIIVGIIFTFAGASACVGAGIGMVLGGAATLLTPTPKYREAELERSTTVGGTVNTVRQGLPVPLGYGQMIIGSQMISVGVVNVDTISSAGATPAPSGMTDTISSDYSMWIKGGGSGSYEWWYTNVFLK